MKGKIAKERPIYNNYDLSENYPDEEIIKQLIENGEERENITEEMLWNERYFYDEIYWEEQKAQLKEFFSKGKWIAFGTVGRWNGLYNAGTIFDDFEKFFYRATEDCNYWKFYDENGHLYLTCSHHD